MRSDIAFHSSDGNLISSDHLPFVMKTAASIIFGFVLALVVAAAAVWLHTALSSLPPEEASGGMAAFGDLVLFIGVFCIFAVMPTLRLLKLLQGCRAFWWVWGCVAALVSATGAVAGLVYLAPDLTHAQQFPLIASLAPLRILATLPLVVAFALSGVFAPLGWNRKTLVGCASVEGIVFAAAAVKLLIAIV